VADAPRGYATDSGLVEAKDAAAPVFYYAALLAAGSVAAIWETAVRQPSMYLDPGGGPPRYIATLATLAGAALGWFVSVRRRRAGGQHDRLAWLLVAASLPAGASAPLWFLAFREPILFCLAAVLAPAATAAAVAAALVTARHALQPAAALDVFGQALRPLRLVASLTVLAALAASTTLLGLIRSACLVGMALAVCAMWTPTLCTFLGTRRPHARTSVAHAALVALVGNAAAFVASARWVGLSEPLAFVHDIAFAHTGRAQRLVITSGQKGFALFLDGQLKVSTVDEQRYYEALVHPAMAVASYRERVAVLGAGDGFAEREILRYPDVRHVTVVVADRTLADLARRSPWLRARSHDSMLSPRVHVIEEEPIVWLMQETEAAEPEFDVVVVDLPDPRSYVEAKSYSRYFYRRLARRLAPGGIASVQATSAFRSPTTFATIEATIREAPLFTLTYRAPISLLGEWGFVLASRRQVEPPRIAPAGLTFLDDASMAQLFQVASDTHPTQAVEANTLYRAPIVEIFAREQHAQAP